jgi:hypothetical protein
MDLIPQKACNFYNQLFINVLELIKSTPSGGLPHNAPKIAKLGNRQQSRSNVPNAGAGQPIALEAVFRRFTGRYWPGQDPPPLACQKKSQR